MRRCWVELVHNRLWFYNISVVNSRSIVRYIPFQEWIKHNLTTQTFTNSVFSLNFTIHNKYCPIVNNVMEPSCSDRYFAQFLEAYSQYCLNSEKYMIVRKRGVISIVLKTKPYFVISPKFAPKTRIILSSCIVPESASGDTQTLFHIYSRILITACWKKQFYSVEPHSQEPIRFESHFDNRNISLENFTYVSFRTSRYTLARRLILEYPE